MECLSCTKRSVPAARDVAPGPHGGRHELDLIIEREDGRVIAIEVKLGADAKSDSVTHLNWLQQQMGDDLLERVVITTGSEAYRRADGICVIPAALLGP
jgi:uncharacterized protein